MRRFTWEISYEDDLSLIVQTALDLLELGPPGREVHQQRHQPRVWFERRPISCHNVHAGIKDPSREVKSK